ncbi:MAG: hypothetical protein ACOCQR_01215 [bacterium]
MFFMKNKVIRKIVIKLSNRKTIEKRIIKKIKVFKELTFKELDLIIQRFECKQCKCKASAENFFCLDSELRKLCKKTPKELTRLINELEKNH